MKIKLPHRTLRLTEDEKMLSGEKKVELVSEILQEKLVHENQEITLEDFLGLTFDNPSSVVIMDMFAYFITKEHRKKQDIMTRETIGKMQRGDGRTINFTNLSQDEKVSMGIDLDDDYR